MTPAPGPPAAPAPGTPAPCGYPYEDAPGGVAPRTPPEIRAVLESETSEVSGTSETSWTSTPSETSVTSDPSKADEAPSSVSLPLPPPPPRTGAENTVSGNATERSSPPFVSVPVHGRAPAGTPGSAPGSAPEPAVGPAPPDPPSRAPEESPAPSPPIPSLSAASCNHSGGVRRNDVWFRSTRDAADAPPAPSTPSSRPYVSSYRRITSPTGNEGHSVASPLSRAITSRCAPPSERGPSARSSAHTTNPRSNSRTRTSRC